MSRVPWETIALDGTDGDAPWLPAAEKGLTHRYAADNLSVAKWLEERLHDEILNVLLVVNPTADLDGAEAEGERVQTMFGKVPNCRLTRLYRDEATRPALLSAFASGEYDVVHYAGHAFFQEDTREASGLLCHGHVPLTGVDLAGLGNLPTLVFFNACESVRVRGGARKGSGTRTVARSTKSAKASKSTKSSKSTKTSGKGKGPGSIAESPTGFAEAFLRGGVANFLGTYWEVGDEPAALFADAFYTRVIGGATLGDAIQEGRAAVRETRSRDWADYVFYGNPDFILKVGASQRGAHE
jgi:CHAT domain-containing protein